MTEPNAADPQFPRSAWRVTCIVIGLAAFLAILLIPLPELPPAARKLAAVSVLMALWWMTQPVPIPVTSLLPLALYPLLGIRPAVEVSRAYADQNIFLFFGGCLIALAIERWNLHRRIALHILGRLGSSLRMIVLGFMLATALLSMWISNTAATLLMLPIGLALAGTLRDALDPELRPHVDRMMIPLLLGIAYSASCGGFATLIGTPTNISLRGFWEREFVSQGAPPLQFADWMILFVPVSGLMILSSAVVMTWNLRPLPGTGRFTRSFFRERLRELGRPSGSEWRVLVIFVSTALLWILRRPLIIGQTTILPDWPGGVARLLGFFGIDASYLGDVVEDSTIAMLMASLLFLLPGERQRDKSRPALLDWETAERGVPWGMLLLFGGGFAMADAFGSTGLSDWIGARFAAVFAGQGTLLLVAGVCILLTFLTEFTSNTATVNTVVPILAAMSVQLKIDPRWLLVPATVSASCAFMLPVATPPNAIVFSSGRIPMGAMIRYGFLLNLCGILYITLAMWWFAPAVLHLSR